MMEHFTEIYSLVSDSLRQTASPEWVRISGQFYLPTECTAIRYRIINNSTGGCGNDLAIDDITFSQCNPTLLPVTGLTLKAENNNGLSWFTLGEKNTDKFLVQKRAGTSEWQTIAAVKAAGESNSRKTYSFIDKTASGKSFYRVISKDIDGKTFYSNVVSMAQNTDNKVNVYPNPFIGQINIELNAAATGPIDVKVFASNGRLVRNLRCERKNGENAVSVPGMENVNKGLYFVSVTGASGSVIARTSVIKL